ncbi:uncharacterized protein TM35_000561150 [Trypanosoma theileri]|uniref:Mucin TcMUCII n=1 Tax=Trypanosoma theileri TaxID=67003 RepID=A0A1X0NGL6_9TRYP|nr:uncharacterized protein TM35_000561150 [Trypanosoma theileri]ORC83817.1 hypothetical protein TM35_000561150 [Trypanosoma theileri]
MMMRYVICILLLALCCTCSIVLATTLQPGGGGLPATEVDDPDAAVSEPRTENSELIAGLEPGRVGTGVGGGSGGGEGQELVRSSSIVRPEQEGKKTVDESSEKEQPDHKAPATLVERRNSGTLGHSEYPTPEGPELQSPLVQSRSPQPGTEPIPGETGVAGTGDGGVKGNTRTVEGSNGGPIGETHSSSPGSRSSGDSLPTTNQNEQNAPSENANTEPASTQEGADSQSSPTPSTETPSASSQANERTQASETENAENYTTPAESESSTTTTTTTTTTTLPPESTNNKKGDADSSSSISSSVWVRVPLLIVVTLACILVC